MADCHDSSCVLFSLLPGETEIVLAMLLFLLHQESHPIIIPVTDCIIRRGHIMRNLGLIFYSEAPQIQDFKVNKMQIDAIRTLCATVDL